MVPREEIPALIRECHELTSILVHVMIDRARQFTSSDLHEEKMASLGKLAAGLAHELNNPASAIVRSAGELKARLAEIEETARALGSARLTAPQTAAVDRARGLCLARRRHEVRELAARTGGPRGRAHRVARAPRRGRHGRRGARGLRDHAGRARRARAGARGRVAPGRSPVARGGMRHVPAREPGRDGGDPDPQPRDGREGLHVHGPGDDAQAGGRRPGAVRHARGPEREGPREVREGDPRQSRPACRGSRDSAASSTRSGRTSSTTRWTRRGRRSPSPRSGGARPSS